jgi:hypothetical protein
MTRPPNHTLSIATQRDKPPLSKAQKTFNDLIKLIENKRAVLANWESATLPYQQKYASELVPLIDASTDLRVKTVHCLDRASAQKGLSRTESRMLSEIISDLAGALVAEQDCVELKAIYNKHSGSDYDQEEVDAVKDMKSTLEDMLNIELGDDLDLNSPEDLLQRAQEQLHAQQAQYEADELAREERRAKRKKSAKQLAQEARQQAEEQQIGQSIREVYRKLASALHPDRETDPQERERKTALMQRVNQAYGKNNLLQLLELQLELEHIDQSSIDNISEERLRHYNKILREQLGELEQEIFHIEDRFRYQFNIPAFAKLSPATLMRSLSKEIATIRQANRNLEKDLLAFGDLKKLKAWLKTLHRQAPTDDFGDWPF